MPSGKAIIYKTMIQLINKRISSEAASSIKMKNRQLHASALITKSGRLVGNGENKYLTKNIHSTNNNTINLLDSRHSETECIKNNINKVKQHTSLIMLIVRTNGGNSRPCYRCATNINNQANIKTVYYTDINDNGEKIIRQESITSLMNPDLAHFSKFQRFKNCDNDTLNTDCCSNDNCSNCDNCNCENDDKCDDDESDDDKPNLFKLKDRYIYNFINCNNIGIISNNLVVNS